MKMKRMLAVLLTECMVVACTLPVSAANENEINQKKNEIQSQIDSKESQIASLEGQKKSVMSSIRELDKKSAEAQKNLDSLAKQIDEKQKEIEKNTEDLKEAQADADAQYEDMKKRIQYMYESGDKPIWNFLLESESFTQMLSRAEAFSQMTAYDREKLQEYEETCKKIEKLESTLKKEKSDLEEYKQSSEKEKKEIEDTIAKKQNEIASFEAGIDSAMSAQADLEGELAIQNQILKKMKEEVKAATGEKPSDSNKTEESVASGGNSGNTGSSSANQQPKPEIPQNNPDSGNSGSSGGGGGSSVSFVMPCPSSYGITSPFGYRNAPTQGASTYHQGVDFGAGTGSPIVAAASGTVTVASYSESAGNYVTISHGNGLYTVYMHASALYVKAGQKVSAGEQIAAVGSTGYSTGPHLHFGVMQNGTYVDPMNYL